MFLSEVLKTPRAKPFNRDELRGRLEPEENPFAPSRPDYAPGVVPFGAGELTYDVSPRLPPWVLWGVLGIAGLLYITKGR